MEPEDARNLAIACLNDGEFLYLYVNPKDSASEDQMNGLYGQTFSVWLDPEGRKYRGAGLRFSFKKGGGIENVEALSSKTEAARADERRKTYYEFKIPMAELGLPAGGRTMLGFEVSDFNDEVAAEMERRRDAAKRRNEEDLRREAAMRRENGVVLFGSKRQSRTGAAGQRHAGEIPQPFQVWVIVKPAAVALRAP